MLNNDDVSVYSDDCTAYTKNGAGLRSYGRLSQPIDTTAGPMTKKLKRSIVRRNNGCDVSSAAPGATSSFFYFFKLALFEILRDVFNVCKQIGKTAVLQLRNWCKVVEEP